MEQHEPELNSSECKVSSTCSEEDELLSLNETNIVFIEASVCSHESLSWKESIINELAVQYEEGRSRSVEEEHRLPECCTGTVDILDCFLSCKDDRKNCGFPYVKIQEFYIWLI